jgi:hypothetical protein
MRHLAQRSLHGRRRLRHIIAAAMVIGSIAVITPANANDLAPPLPTGGPPDNFVVALASGGTFAGVNFVDNNTNESRYSVTRRDGIGGQPREVWSQQCCESGQPQATNRTYSFRDEPLDPLAVHCWRAGVVTPAAGFVTGELCRASGPPSQPRFLTVVYRTPTSINLDLVRSDREWVYQTHYRVAGSFSGWRLGEEFAPTSDPRMVPVVSTRVTGLDPGVEYCFRVTASNPRGESLSNTVCGVPGTAPPTPPNSLDVTSTTPTTVTLQFADRAANEVGYRLSRLNPAEGLFRVVADIPVLNGGTLSYTDFGLTPNTTYLYQLETLSNVNGSSKKMALATTS